MQLLCIDNFEFFILEFIRGVNNCFNQQKLHVQLKALSTLCCRNLKTKVLFWKCVKCFLLVLHVPLRNVIKQQSLPRALSNSSGRDDFFGKAITFSWWTSVDCRPNCTWRNIVCVQRSPAYCGQGLQNIKFTCKSQYDFFFSRRMAKAASVVWYILFNVKINKLIL